MPCVGVCVNLLYENSSCDRHDQPAEDCLVRRGFWVYTWEYGILRWNWYSWVCRFVYLVTVRVKGLKSFSEIKRLDRFYSRLLLFQALVSLVSSNSQTQAVRAESGEHNTFHDAYIRYSSVFQDGGQRWSKFSCFLLRHFRTTKCRAKKSTGDIIERWPNR